MLHSIVHEQGELKQILYPLFKCIILFNNIRFEFHNDNPECTKDGRCNQYSGYGSSDGRFGSSIYQSKKESIAINV